MINRVVYGIDQLSRMVGHAFAWSVVILTMGTTYEVIVRYGLNAPTSWAFDFSYTLYGGLFLMAGAYTLSRGGHVRADMFYRLWRPRVQAAVELILFITFFFPGIISLTVAGWDYGIDSFRIREKSIWSPIGFPVWQIKMLIPVGGVFMTLQGVAEVLRCIQCLHQGSWPPRLHDVEELEEQLIRERRAELARQQQQQQPGMAEPAR